MSTIKANNVTAVDANTDLTLTGDGTGTVNLPTGFKVNSVVNSFLSSATNVTVAQGGTGAGTFTDNGILYGNGTGAIAATAVGTAAQVLTSNGAGVAPTFQDVAGGGLFKGDNGTTGNAVNGPKDIFRINEQELNTSTTITASENASATGPLSVASGVTLTVEGNLTII